MISGVAGTANSFAGTMWLVANCVVGTVWLVVLSGLLVVLLGLSG